MPKIRHLAIVCMDPEKLAQFYCEVFDMKVVQRNGRQNVFLSAGYITRRCSAKRPKASRAAQSLRLQVEDPMSSPGA